MSITVLAPGLLTTVQDGGRHGHAGIGVGTAGAMDSVALRLANILVGNVENAPVLEITLRGPRLRFDSDSVFAIAGAQIDAQHGAEPVPMWQPVLVRAGTELGFGNTRHGARAYLAIAGSFDKQPQLGSCSVDLNAGIGGRALAAGDVLITAAAPRTLCPSLWADLDKGDLDNDRHSFAATKWSLDPAPWLDGDSAQPLRVIAGRHCADLDLASQQALFGDAFRISADSNRVGYRLEGAPLRLREPLELVSAGVVPGTVQLPPGGAPIVLMAEAPTIGGYPRIAQVIAVDMPRLAQRRPGDSVRFTEISLKLAQTRYLERERAIATLAHTINERLHA
jgi:antagonist of KipI